MIPQAHMVWHTLDGLARERGFTPSALARDGGSVVVVPSLPLRVGDRVLMHGSGREPVMGLMLDTEAGQAICSFRGAEVHAVPTQEGVAWLHRIVMMTV